MILSSEVPVSSAYKKLEFVHTFALVRAIREIGRSNRESLLAAALALSLASCGGHIVRPWTWLLLIS